MKFTGHDGRRVEPATLHHRRDIDGMRALAITAVILFHAFPELCPGGFIGVDIFFVLSGYLISSIILIGLSRGEFSFSGFYSRRIRRIFPALLPVLAFCLAAGWLILTPGEWHSLAKSAFAGAAFASNLLQFRTPGYFDPPAQTQPLLHLWSLGIEEQFYLVWPPAVLILWKLGRKWKRGDAVLTGILLITAASFAFDITMLPSHPQGAFYDPLTRMWELLAGAALARFAMLFGGLKRRVIGELMSAAGALLIAGGLMFLNRNTPLPGWWSWLPVLGTVFLLSAGPEALFNRRVLACRPAVFVGLISYPLYLWHWPLLVFLRLVLESDYTLGPRQTEAAQGLVLVLALVLSSATYTFWEAPMRFSTRLSSRFRAQVLIAGMSLIALGALVSVRFVQPRLDSPSVVELEHAANDVVYMGNWKMLPLRTYVIASHSSDSALLVGDSLMEQYIPRAQAAIKADPELASAVFATSGDCLPLPNVNPIEPGFRCPVFYDYWKALAFEPRFSTLAISANWLGVAVESDYSSYTFHGHPAAASDFDEAWRTFESDLRLLVKAGKRVIILTQSPTARAFDPKLGIRRLRAAGVWRPSGVPRPDWERYVDPMTRRLNDVARDTGAEIISTLDYLCRRDVCPAIDSDGSPIYRDPLHLRASKAAKLATFVDEVLRPHPRGEVFSSGELRLRQ